ASLEAVGRGAARRVGGDTCGTVRGRPRRPGSRVILLPRETTFPDRRTMTFSHDASFLSRADLATHPRRTRMAVNPASSKHSTLSEAAVLRHVDECDTNQTSGSSSSR